MITQKIKLNLIPGGILPRIKASQYDTGARTLVFKLYNGAQEFTIPTDSTVSIRGTKSDHTGFQYECEYSGNEVTAKITDQMTVSPGEVLAELVITNDGNRIATGNFIFENEEAALKEDVPISHTDIPWIEHIDDLVDLVEEDAQRAETAADRAEDALGQIGDSVEQAASSASAAATSATNSANSAAQATSSATSASNSATAASTSEANALASEQAAKTSEDNANASATQAATSASNAADSASDSADSATNALASKQAAKTSEDNANASKNAAAQSALDASGSASAANASATQAATSATNAATSEGNAAISAANAATSETNASQSATDAAGSATDARDSASDADASATNAENSATLARKWAVGDSGSGSNVPSDTNNAYYWAQVAASAASGGLKIEIVDTLPTANIKTDTIYLVPSANPEEKNVKDEYLNINGTTTGWELIGSTKIDLSGYYTKAQIDAIVQDVKDYADGKVAELKTYVQENYTPTTMLKDTVGWTGKNLIPYPYIEKTHTQSGITWTDNGDGTITANGTATAYSELTIANRVTSPLHFPTGKYILSGCPSGGSASTYRIIIGKTVDSAWSQLGVDSGNGCIFDIDKNDDIGLNIGAFTGTTMENLTFYPMLRRADIADDTWEPYHESVEEVVEELQEFDSDYANVYGAKNLIPYPSATYIDSGNPVTYSGVTYNQNSDNSLVLNGTATKESAYHFLKRDKDSSHILKETGARRYKLTCYVNDENVKYGLYIGYLDQEGKTTWINPPHPSNIGSVVDYEFDVTNEMSKYGWSIQLASKPNQIYSDFTARVMLRLASIKDDEWQPYAKTNKQLTKDVKRLEAYEFETLEAAQAAVQAGKVPDGAIIYIPGENGGSSDTYTKTEIDNMLANKADGLGYDSSTGRLSLKRGTQELGNVTIKSGWKMPSAIAFNQRVDRNWDGLGVLRENATDVTADFDSGVLSQKIAANNFDDYDLGMQIIKTININGTNYTAHIIFAHANAFYGGYNNYSVVNTPNIGCIVFVENYTTVFGDTTTGYKSSNLRIAVQEIVEALKNAIGINHMIPHSNCLSIKATNGVSNDNRWFENSYGEAMSSDQVIGFLAGNLFDSGESFGRLALFSHIIPFQLTDSTILLRDILPSGVARINNSGLIDSVPSNFGTGVAVFIMLK